MNNWLRTQLNLISMVYSDRIASWPNDEIFCRESFRPPYDKASYVPNQNAKIQGHLRDSHG